jgi:asparagine synthase (glutamine-hydrolysing)
MCGLAGILDPSARYGAETLLSDAGRMADRIVHRGPDSGGAWSDPRGGAALGHRRLAILDLSPDGAQPMMSRDARYVLAFNGEIYNFRILKQELAAAGHSFKGHSDTEVMLAAFCEWGVRAAVGRFVGMFAFALWDARERVLHLCRDRLGEKPLYYGWSGGVLLFGSELKALRVHPAWRGEVDRDALTLLFKYNYIPPPYSIHQGIRKMMPGTILSVPCGPGAEAAEPETYWSLEEAVAKGIANPFKGSDDEAVRRFEGHLLASVRDQMVADVPLGAFLSGGVDSSMVVAMMQAQSARPVKTFTIGFHEKRFDEATHARSVAAHLGTEHTELYVSPNQALEVIPKLPEIYDEPFADVSQIPTYLVSMMTRKHVKVSLSGDGADEMLGGYKRYGQGQRIRRALGLLPEAIRRSSGKALGALCPALESALNGLDPLFPPCLRQANLADKAVKLAELLSVESLSAIYPALMCHWKRPLELILDSKKSGSILENPGTWPATANFLDLMIFLDSVSYLPGDILVKVDRAAMANSLETRAPFLDYRLFEFCMRLPERMKSRNGQGKWLLRQVLYKYLPAALFERPKMGFGVPLRSWLRGPLKDWGENLLDAKTLREDGILDPAIVRARWEEHVSGRRNWHYQLWDVLAFQSWLDHQRRSA